MNETIHVKRIASERILPDEAFQAIRREHHSHCSVDATMKLVFIVVQNHRGRMIYA